MVSVPRPPEPFLIRTSTPMCWPPSTTDPFTCTALALSNASLALARIWVADRSATPLLVGVGDGAGEACPAMLAEPQPVASAATSAAVSSGIGRTDALPSDT